MLYRTTTQKEKTMFTVEDLRNSGAKVKVLHYRLPPVHKSDKYNPKGGKTSVIVIMNNETFEATATCSKKDNYNKKMGVKIALGRIMHGQGINCETAV